MSGDAVIFDVRIAHAGQMPTLVEAAAYLDAIDHSMDRQDRCRLYRRRTPRVAAPLLLGRRDQASGVCASLLKIP